MEARGVDAVRLQVVPVLITSMDGISTIRVYLPKDLRQADQRQAVYKSIQVRRHVHPAART